MFLEDLLGAKYDNCISREKKFVDEAANRLDDWLRNVYVIEAETLFQRKTIVSPENLCWQCRWRFGLRVETF